VGRKGAGAKFWSWWGITALIKTTVTSPRVAGVA